MAAATTVLPPPCMQLYFDDVPHVAEQALPLSEARKRISFSWTAAPNVLNALVIYRNVKPREYNYMTFNIRNADLGTGNVIVAYQPPSTPGPYKVELYAQTFAGPIPDVERHDESDGKGLLKWLPKVCETTLTIRPEIQKAGAAAQLKKPTPAQTVVVVTPVAAVTAPPRPGQRPVQRPAQKALREIKVGDQFTEVACKEQFEYEVTRVEKSVDGSIPRFWATTLPNRDYVDEYRTAGPGKWYRVGERPAGAAADIRWH